MTNIDVGYLNPNGQKVVRLVGPSPTVFGQKTYELECQQEDDKGNVCGRSYGANGSDIDGARCPVCQNGSPGTPILDRVQRSTEEGITVVNFLHDILPHLDDQLAEEEMRIELRPLHAAVRIAEDCVFEIETEGQLSVPDFENLKFITQPWFRAFYQVTEQWYRKRYGEAFDQRPSQKAVAFIVISGMPFRVEVPLSVISPGKPGKSVWLRLPDSVLSGEDVTAWLKGPPNLSEISSEKRMRVVQDLEEIGEFHRSIAAHHIGIPNSTSINRGLLQAVRGHLRAASQQVLDNWEQKGTAKAVWELQMACECAFKALAEAKTGTFRQTHDLFLLYDEVAGFLDGLERNELKRLPRWEDMVNFRYGQGLAPRLEASYQMYVSTLKVVNAALSQLAVLGIGKAAFEIGRPPWMIPFDSSKDEGSDNE